MLPKCRTEGDPYSVPKFEVVAKDVEDFTDELRAFHQNFAGCFSRSEPRENFFKYMTGQFSELERKSIEPMALHIEGANVRALQRFVSDVVWDQELILKKYHKMVNEDLGDPEAALIFDETSFPKKGDESVGVARQYCGSLGKIDNCQVGVFAAYASPHGYALLDKRLFIPERWFSNQFLEKKKKCEVPDEITFRTKPQLAAEMIQEIAQNEILPFKYILGDSIYGNSPDFINAAQQIIGVTYFVSINPQTLCWLRPPSVGKRGFKIIGGEIRPRRVLLEKKDPIKVSDFAKSLNNFYWYKRTVSEGAKGPISYEFTKRRITLYEDGLPGKEVWLIVRRRRIDNKLDYSYFISNAPISTRLDRFVWLAGLRWAIEQCFEETKTELGLDHYEVRKFRGWNQHMLTCIMAHFFLWHLKIRLGKKSTVHYYIAA
jgi:SRSO17 transposase